MPAIHKLSALSVRSAGVGKYSDGDGLWLFKSSREGGKWVLRYTISGRRREMGLGGIRNVSLKQARETAAHWRSEVAQGKDPIKERDRIAPSQLKADTSLETITKDAFEARKAELKGDGKAGRWMSPLTIHVLPKLGRVPVGDLDQRDIKDVLAPIWHTKADTARKAMNRISLVLKHAVLWGKLTK